MALDAVGLLTTRDLLDAALKEIIVLPRFEIAHALTAPHRDIINLVRHRAATLPAIQARKELEANPLYGIF